MTVYTCDVTHCDVNRVASLEYVRARIGRFNGLVDNKAALVIAISNLQAILLR